MDKVAVLRLSSETGEGKCHSDIRLRASLSSLSSSSECASSVPPDREGRCLCLSLMYRTGVNYV
ncbi:hypothetical protein E2C01_086314 [Portunus trituberculatus]|uniref:Uncharacterized protein n=1 Tax=Portunus trituberculatus TaxID=210409 RepID=A0A5B7J8Z3_PORTR|nr:hypothetical protein [Portunus trituberculatus]